MWHFEFACCPQVPGNSSVAHQSPWFGVRLLLFWFTGGLFLCLAPFLWGKVRDPSASSLLSALLWWFCWHFQFCSVLLLWMLFTGSGDELCGPLSALFYTVAYHLSPIGPPASPVFVYWKFPWRSAPCPCPPSPVCLQHPAPSAACFFSVLCLLFSFLGFFCGISLSRELCWFIQGWLCEYRVILICSPVGLPDVSQASLEPVSGGMGALLFSQCKVAWRSFVWTGGSGCWSFDSFWCFFSAKCGSIVSARFLIYRTHTVCFCPLVTILDRLHFSRLKFYVIFCQLPFKTFLWD
jgi:hypothetical protein